MLNNYSRQNSKATANEEEESYELAINSRQEFSSVLLTSDNNVVSCLRCNQCDQIQVFDKINCLCSVPAHPFGARGILNRNQISALNKSMRLENPGQLFNFINKSRKWIKVWSPSNIVEPSAEFSVTSYNILSQNLLLNHLYLYQDNTKSDLAWSDRGERLKQELLELNSDIFCLQEVHYENFKATILPSLLERGYQAVFKNKTGNHLDGCSIMFKKSKFRLQDALEVEFNRQDISHLLDKDNVALAVKLRPINLNKEVDTNLVVANTHLLFNPKRGDIKLAQLRLLFAELQRFSAVDNSATNASTDPFVQKYSPVIFCGDMNSEPHSPLVKFIENGTQDLSGIKSGDVSGQREGIDRGRQLQREDLLLKGINLNSCYDKLADENGQLPPEMIIRHVFSFKSAIPNVDEYDKKLISMSTYYDCGLVDHIFYSFKHRNLRLSAFKQLLTKRHLSSVGHLPNSCLGSDHIALSAKFYLL